MKKIALICVAVLLLLSLVTGCATTPATEQPAAPDAPAADQSTPAQPAEDPAEAPVEEPAEDVEPEQPEADPTPEAPKLSVPFSEPKTFSVWANSMMLPTGFSSYEDCEVWQELERRTNAHVEWTVASAASSAEQFSLMLTGGEYTDIFCAPSLTGGYDYSIDEEIIIDLSELVPEYAPNYWGLLTQDDETRRSMFTDSGNMPGLNCINKSYERIFRGYYVRQDWLDMVGYTGELKTYDDWETVMALWQSELGISNALFLDSATGQAGLFMAGLGTLNNFHQTNGVVTYAPIEQGYYDYLDLMSRWFEAGYVDKDYMGNASFFASMGKFTAGGSYAGEFGLFPAFHTSGQMLTDMGKGSLESYELSPVVFPRRNAEDMLTVNPENAHPTVLVGGLKTCISGQCEDVESVLTWIDYLFTEEGYLLSNYGIEGVSYELVDGEVQFTDYYLNSDELGETSRRYAIQSNFPTWYDWERGIDKSDVMAAKATEVWEEYWDINNNGNLPTGVALTTEESEETTSKLADIRTLVEEYTGKVILGETDLASSWDSFVADVQQMGIQDCIDAYQAAYDRYQAR